jgi:iron complex outermembrane receptor protein
VLIGTYRLAEIIPVEPEQGNACEGKVYCFTDPLHLLPLFPLLTFKIIKMKKFLGTTIIVFLTSLAFGQANRSTVTGILTDATSKTPLAGAVINLGKLQLLSDNNGAFQFVNLLNGKYTLTIISFGYQTYQTEVEVAGTIIHLEIPLTGNALYLQPLEVRATRASATAPFTKTNISKEQIALVNTGQDLPFLLNQTPSTVINSDAGNGVGYTGIHIRGSDASRINVTLNGIPYNDAESMGTYFVDLPDFASSINSIQIQRGVGTSSNGAGAFGATINLATNEFNEKPYTELNNGFGSFNTWKNTLKFGTGLLAKHFTIDARFSKIASDGYIDRASSDLRSFYLSAAYVNNKSSLRFNVFSGKEKTYQAWYGISESQLALDRRFNPAGMEKQGTPYENQTDNYTQTHYQLFYNHSFHSKWAFSTALFITKGKGYYEEYKADQAYTDYGLPNQVDGNSTYAATDIIRQRWLDNDFYGQIASLQYKTQNDELTFGGGWTKYEGKHFGNIIWMKIGTVSADYHYYDYPATKWDENFYTKWMHKFNSKWQSFIDIQYRNVTHQMEGFEGNSNLSVHRIFQFVNPKMGITYTHNGWQGYLSYALGNKEPNRDDFQASILNQPRQESLQDLELGLEKRTQNLHYGATLYYMNYSNQLVLTGQINDVGSYTRTNVPKSYRLGIELQASVVMAEWLNIAGNITFSKNKIKSFTEYIDNYDTGGQDAIIHQNTDISFSPNTIGSMSLNFQIKKNFGISLLNKFVGRQFMDNTQNESSKLDAYFTQDIRAVFSFKNKLLREWHVIGQLNNLFNVKYQPNGYAYSYIYNSARTNENGYYPMAGTNIMLTLNINF